MRSELQRLLGVFITEGVTVSKDLRNMMKILFDIVPFSRISSGSNLKKCVD
jgi:hypothetical protein